MLFSNRKKTDDRQPDFKAEATVDLGNGQTITLDLAMWRKQSDRAGEYFSLSLKPKQDRQSTTTGKEHFHQRVQQMGTPVDDEDIHY
jgi:hypothetical protein